MKFNKAGSKVERMAKLLINEHFPHLKTIKILYVFRAKAKPGEDGTVIAGMARVLPTKLQDLWGYQAEIELALPVWNAMSASRKRRLLWHELRHLQVELDDDEKPIEDKEGRVALHCDDHDVHIRTFSDELRMFGLEKSDIKVLRTLYRIYKDYKAGKIKVVKPFKMDDSVVELG
jgi:hypothetical protein